MKFLTVLLFTSFLSLTFQVEAAEKQKTDLKEKITSIQKQLDDLVYQGGNYAYLQLAQKNNMSPFAVGIEKNGRTLMLEIAKDQENLSVSDKVLKLREMLKLAADSNKIYAGALFVQAQVPHLGKQVNGVAIEMEHVEGLSVLRFSPFEINREEQKIDFKKPVDEFKPVVFFKDAKNK